MKHDVRIVEGARENYMEALAIYRHCFRCGRDVTVDGLAKTMREECIPLDIDPDVC